MYIHVFDVGDIEISQFWLIVKERIRDFHSQIQILTRFTEEFELNDCINVNKIIPTK